MSTVSGTITHTVVIQSSGPYGTPLTITNTGAVDIASIGAAVDSSSNFNSTLVNYGRISNSGAGRAVFDTQNLTLDNHGLISAGGYGIELNAGGPITNSGTISGAIGIKASSGNAATVVDTGTIIGTAGTAASFGGGNDLLKFQPSSSVFIQGTVDGGGGTNTLEFASAATVGTLTGAGAYFANFSNGTLDAGAQWVFAGDNTIGATTSFVDSGTLTNIGTLTNSGTLSVTGTISNAASGVITGSNNAITGSGTAGVSNLGTITAAALSGITLASGAVVNGATDNTAALIAGGTKGVGASGTATVTNYGTITASDTAGFGVSLANGGVINGASGDTTALISGTAYGVRLQSGQISNYGTVSGSIGVRINGAGSLTNHAGALIVGTATGFNASGASETISNLGTIRATSGNGIVASGNGVVIVNGSSGATSGLISGGSRGVVLQANGDGTLFNYGTITGVTGLYDNGGLNTVRSTVINAGTIIGTGGTAISAGALGSSNLLLRFVGDSFIQGVVNGERGGVGVLQFASGAAAGTLTGSNAVFVNFQTASVDAGAYWVLAGTNTFGANTTLTDSGTLANAGTMTVTGTLAVSGTLTNTGTVTGAGVITASGMMVNQGEIDDSVTLTGGRLSNAAAGYVGGGAYGVQINGGYGATITNFGTIVGTVGVTVTGSGTVGQTIVDAGAITGSGGTAVMFGSGNDRLIVDPGAAFTGLVDGGGGTNTLELAVGAQAGTLTGLGTQFTNFAAETVDAGASWVLTGSNTVGSGVTLADSGRLTNAGQLTVAAYGLQLAPGGYLRNTSGSSIIETGSGTAGSYPAVYGQAGGATTVVNAGTITGLRQAIALQDGGRVTNGSSAAIVSSNGDGVFIGSPGTTPSTAIVSNAGTITGNGNNGIFIIGTGTVSNQGSITGSNNGIIIDVGGAVTNGAGGVIVAGNVGISIDETGTVINRGSLQVGNVGISIDYGSATNGIGGVIVADNVGISNDDANGITLNQGTITGDNIGISTEGGRVTNAAGATVVGHNVGISIEGGQATNAAGATIIGYSTGFSAFGGGTLTNFGTILGSQAGAVGVQFLNGGTVFDGGAISGASGTAVQFAGTGANLLVLEHGYTIGGSIVGSSGSATNTLELLGNGSANAVTVDYNGLTLTNFGTVAFAAGASNFATLTITDTTALPGTITGLTGVHDAIDLTQLSDTGNDATYSFNASTHVLTVTGDNGSVQLHLGNGAYGGGFSVTNDGHGGTKITGGGPAAPTLSSITASGPGITGGSAALKAGKTVTLTVKFDQAVTVAGGTPTLTLNDGGTATYVRGSGSKTLVFTYTVGAGQNTADLTVTGLSLNGSRIQNSSGKPADLTGAATNPAGVLQIDTTAPTATAATATALEDSAPTPIGITVPGGQGTLTVKITGLPTDGTVFLADRKTKVTAGQILTVAQLQGLTFQPTLNEHDKSSTLTYSLTDAAGNSTTGTATLKIDVDNGLFYVTPSTLAGRSYDGTGNHTLIVQGSGAANLAGVKGFTEIVLDGALSVSLGNGNFTGVNPPNLIVTAETGGTTIDLTKVTAAADRVLVNVKAGNLASDTITGVGVNDALLISGAGKASLAKVTGIGNIDLGGAVSIALSDGAANNFTGVAGGRIAVTASVGHVVIDDSAVKNAADGVVIFADAADLASDRITGSASGNDVLHVLGSGAVGLAGVTGVGTMYFSGGESVSVADGNFTGVTGGRIFATLGGGGVTLDGSGIKKAGNSLFVSVSASDLVGDTLTGGAGPDALQIAGGGTTLNLGKVSGFDYLTITAGSSGDTVALGNANFTGTSGLIVVTDLGSGNRINGAAITAGANRNLIVHGASGDTLTGGGGTNFLVAGGGLETLVGGTGDTGFALTSATGKATIQRFTATDDQIVFSDAAFNLGANEGQGGASPRQLAASVFSANTNGTFASAQNRFAYNSATGVLYYSADGQNADKVSVAVLTGHPALKSQDLYFFA